MSKRLRLAHAFDRAVNTTAYAVACIAASVSTGAGVYFGLDSTPDTKSTATMTEQIAAQAQVKQMANDILKQEHKIRFDARTLEQMQSNAGNGKEPLAKQKGEIDAMYAQLSQDREAQNTRLANLRREFLFNPGLSERASTELYVQLWEKANDSGYTNIRNFFPPFKDSLTFRDECKLERHATGKTAQTATNDAALSIVSCGNDSDTVHDYKEAAFGFASGLGALSAFAGLGAFAAALRRRADAHEKAKNAVTTDKRLEIVVRTHKNS